MRVRNPYNYDMEAASMDTGLECRDASMTKQSFAVECDINEIVRRFGLSGEMPQDVRMPMSGDFEGILDYKSCLDTLIAADEKFMEFPASLRARFENDPGKLIEFLSDEKNRPEAEKLGLVPAKVVPAAPAAPVAAPAGTPKPA